MKYRIKKVTYKNGEITYFAQYYTNWFRGWRGIFYDGELASMVKEVGKMSSREEALECIDLAVAGKGVVVVVKIEFENITK